MSDKKIKASFIPDNAVTEVSKKLYDDVAHKPLTQVGDAAESLMKLVFLPFKCLGMTVDELENKYKAFLIKTLSKVPEDKLAQPSPVIAGKILEHIKYIFDEDILIELFSNLLAADINIDTKDDIHPSYVTNAISLSPYDAQILIFLSVACNRTPTIYLSDIELYGLKGSSVNYKKLFFHSDFELNITPKQSGISFTHLDSIGIVKISKYKLNHKEYCAKLKYYCPYNNYPDYFYNALHLEKYQDVITGNDNYSKIELNDDFFNAIKQMENREISLCVNRKCITTTDYGKDFIKFCTEK